MLIDHILGHPEGDSWVDVTSWFTDNMTIDMTNRYAFETIYAKLRHCGKRSDRNNLIDKNLFCLWFLRFLFIVEEMCREPFVKVDRKRWQEGPKGDMASKNTPQAFTSTNQALPLRSPFKH